MIGIIAAMTVEREAIQKHMEDVRPWERDGRYFLGTIEGKDVVLCEGGIGKVASAITCTRMLESFDIEMLINIGTAGGIKDYEDELDVVIGTLFTYHDWDCESINGIPRSFVNNNYVFQADESLVEKARAVMETVNEHATHIGPIVSGDAFVSSPERVEQIKKDFPEAVACDMESTSIGHVCTEYGVPFLVIRSLSDIVTKEGNDLDFHVYVELASNRSSEFTRRFIASL